MDTQHRKGAHSLGTLPPASLGTLTLGRLLANRPSRSGWRAIPRQIWAHAGTVEASTPDTWSWPRRRLTHLARALRLIRG